MMRVAILKSFSYTISASERSIFGSSRLAKTEWFDAASLKHKTIIDLFIEDVVTKLVKLNNARLTYEYHGQVMLSAELKYINSLNIEIKTSAFSIVVPDDVDNMNEKLHAAFDQASRKKIHEDLDAYIEQLRS